MQEEILRVETLEESHVEGWPECESVMEKAGECQQDEKNAEDGALVEVPVEPA